MQSIFKKIFKWKTLLIIAISILIGVASYFIFNILNTYLNFGNLSNYLKNLSTFIPNYWFLFFIFFFFSLIGFLIWWLLKSNKSFIQNSKSNEYGSAKFLINMKNSKNKDFKNFMQIYKSDEKNNGFVILMTKIKNNFKCFKVFKKHVLINGATGAGKTQKIIIPNIFENAKTDNAPSMVIVDPKSEIYEKTAEHLKLNGYQIWRIDIRDFEKSHQWNPLSIIWSKYELFLKENNKSFLLQAEKYLNSTADYLFKSNKDGEDKHWTSGAKSIFLGIAWLLLQINEITKTTIIKKDYFNIYNIIYLVNSRNSELDDWIMLLIKLANKYGIENRFYNYLANTLFNEAPETTAGFMGNFATSLNLFTTQATRFVLSDNEVDFEKFLNQKQAIFIVVPDEDKTFHKIIGLLVNQLYVLAIEMATKNKNQTLTRELDFILDEFANIPPLPDFETKISASRSRNIFFMCVVQSISQVQTNYKNSYETIINNFNAKVWLSTSEKDAETLSKSFGKKTVLETSFSKSSSSKNDSSSNSQHIKAINLMNQDEILSLEDPYGFITQNKVNPSLVKFAYAWQNPIINNLPVSATTPREINFLDLLNFEDPKFLKIKQKVIKDSEKQNNQIEDKEEILPKFNLKKIVLNVNQKLNDLSEKEKLIKIEKWIKKYNQKLAVLKNSVGEVNEREIEANVKLLNYLKQIQKSYTEEVI